MKRIVELNDDLVLLGLLESRDAEEFVDIGEGYRVPLASMKKYIELTKSIKKHTGQMATELDRRRDSLHQEMADGAVREQGLDPETSEEWQVVMLLISDYVEEHFKGLKESLGMVAVSDLNLLKRYRPDLEAELAVSDKRDQLFRNLEKSDLRRRRAPTLDLPDAPSVVLSLADKAIAGQPLTDVQSKKIKSAAQALKKYAAEVKAAERKSREADLPF